MRRALAIAAVLATATSARADDCAPVPVWRDGHAGATVCRADAASQGLTIIDLRDDWTPPVLAGGPSYAATYRALAQEHFADAGGDGRLARQDRYLELFGVSPAPSVVQARLAEADRAACHDAIDPAPLAAELPVLHEETAADARSRIVRARDLRAELEHDARAAQLADLAELAAHDAYHRRAVARLATLEARTAAIRAVQAHLACDALFEDKPFDGALSWQTTAALARFQRGAMVLPTGALDVTTRAQLALPAGERDLRTALRVLRERVAAGAGILADGSAGAGSGPVLGRALEPEAIWHARGAAPRPGAALDELSPATEAAARALGWTDAAAVRAWLTEVIEREVAVALPPSRLPAAFDIEAEIDPGDVSRVRGFDPPHRPSLTVYAVTPDARIPLVRWPTTVGGWQYQDLGGELALRFKASPVGTRIWRDLFVGPTWLPPKSTPDRELVRRGGGAPVLARDVLGPSYRAAFGMLAFVHLVEDPREPWDQGIRTHGTGNLTSLASGASHGCHRVVGLQIVRLADFVLAHHAFVRHGDAPTYYRRTVRAGDRAFPVAIDSLGYRIELLPPLRVTVLPQGYQPPRAPPPPDRPPPP